MSQFPHNLSLRVNNILSSLNCRLFCLPFRVTEHIKFYGIWHIKKVLSPLYSFLLPPWVAFINYFFFHLGIFKTFHFYTVLKTFSDQVGTRGPKIRLLQGQGDNTLTERLLNGMSNIRGPACQCCFCLCRKEHSFCGNWEEEKNKKWDSAS